MPWRSIVGNFSKPFRKNGHVVSKKPEDGKIQVISDGKIDPLPSSLVHQTARIAKPLGEDAEQQCVLGQNRTNNGELHTIESLWDRAYTALKTNDAKLVEKYETYESNSSNDSTSMISGQDNGNLDGTENRIEQANPSQRREQLEAIINSGLQQADENKNTYTIFGHEFTLQDQISQAAKLVQWVKGVIDEAVKVSPEVSIAWAGVSLILPILTHPTEAEQARCNGFIYVRARIRFYIAVEPLLLSQNQYSAVAVSGPLKSEFESHIVELYQNILEFQFNSVLHFYRSRRRNFARGLINDIFKSAKSILILYRDNFNTMNSRYKYSKILPKTRKR
ncbi:uncharacterized protein TRIVIDRAFT_219543 [Trichoderma virens Gv29-8]|uniref:NWD NACHT-NTPase N-terminal domain-containing protein n=1 Tax=Hypocrea virens (strain Gv29-8 / FGSC 10586) TaxID=413071 RepID=G9MJX3_HYPVG|nr:uncharacterized protein TRIVIDRAFT_219543 [Trichoderma virens Gv29-8]EHK25781.1 hypothetical protein TRIVIDRAFT_219543 [Trichoderma virens Gv29-8]UKZ48396.1 hypothetical protein TrVGV298_002619 [Trichoderma virens]